MRVEVSGVVRLDALEMPEHMIEHVRKELTIRLRVPKGYEKFKKGKDRGREALILPMYRLTPTHMEVPRAWWFATAMRDHDYDIRITLGKEMGVKETALTFEGPFEEQRHAVDLFVRRYKRAYERATSGEPGSARSIRYLGGILRASVGFGKTNAAIQIAVELGRVALIVVHKEFLARQWVERIQSVVPGARVGVVQGDKCEFRDVDFIVAMAQSLALCVEQPDRYPRELFQTPGLLIVDEVHRIGARTWAPIPGMFPAAYRLGLSATPRRKDGADRVFWNHIGEIVYSAKTETPKPGIRVVKYSVNRGIIPRKLHRDTVTPGEVVTFLGSDDRRNALIVAEIRGAVRSKSKRKVLVLSERLEHLERIEALIRDYLPDVTVGRYVGQWFSGEPKADHAGRVYRVMRRRKSESGERMAFTRDGALGKDRLVVLDGTGVDSFAAETVNGVRVVNVDALNDKNLKELAKALNIELDKAKRTKSDFTEEELKEAERAQVILATYQMVQEGVDIPACDTLILATPISDVEQALGRVRRVCVPEPKKCAHYCQWRAGECKGKPSPVVVDVQDEGFSLGRKRSYYRNQYYESSGMKTAVVRTVK